MSEDKNLNHKFPHVPIWELMNIKVVEMGEGTATLTMPFDSDLTNPYGMMHGSAAYALADSAVAVAISTITQKGKQFFTIEMKVNYLEPVSDGILEAKAKVLREGRIVPGEVDVYNENKLVAKALATYIIVDEKK
ncbi:MAG: PaaI family thioesterase [Thermodesulfobacteriota bacterium]